MFRTVFAGVRVSAKIWHYVPLSLRQPAEDDPLLPHIDLVEECIGYGFLPSQVDGLRLTCDFVPLLRHIVAEVLSFPVERL